MSNNAKYSSHGPDFDLKAKEMDLKAGMLGKFFGSSDNARLNIAGFTACLLTLSGIIMIFIPVAYTKISPAEYWKIIAPIITLILGYIFGQNNKAD